MHSSQIVQAGITLSFLLDILVADGIHSGISDGVAVLIQHVGAGIFADLNGGHNVIEKGLIGDEIYHADNLAPLNTILPQGGGYHDGQFPGDLTDRGGGEPGVALDGLLEILPVRVVVAVKQAHAVGAQQIAALHAVIICPGVDQALFLSNRNSGVAELRNHTKSCDCILIGL